MRTLLLAIILLLAISAPAQTWRADNGNGTYTNPLFYDEFSDPDLIRVGANYYLTGTTMHAMPGLPVLHSRDLVNWKLLGYAFDRLDLGPEFRLEGEKEIYGQGIWAPSFRYHNGTFHIFTNINRRRTQLFRATNPAGPWTRTELDRSFHDLSVLFDTDGRIYVIWGYQEIRFAQLNAELTGIVPGTERVLIPKEAGMGEGVHFYKIEGKYYITSAWFAGRMRMPCARADRPEGPYEVNPAISADEDFGLAEGYRLQGRSGPPFKITPPNPASRGRMSLHQGGIVNTPSGEWWGFSMMDYNSVGRLTGLSPVTWKEGWPYFGLPGNLGRTPRTWAKPKTAHASPPAAPYERNDEFSGPKLNAVWQWNHLPEDSKWSLTERPGFLRLHSLPAADFWRARNTLTQRSIGPISIPTVALDARGMKPGDVAGLGLLNLPYAWIGLRREADGVFVIQYDQMTGETTRARLAGTRGWLRAQCDFLTETARFSYSADGKTFEPLGREFPLVFQLKTFQGVRYSLFHYHQGDGPGGYADFDRFRVEEPYPRGLMRPVPVGRTITLAVYGKDAVLFVKDGVLSAAPAADLRAGAATARFTVVDRGLGRVALKQGGGYLSVSAATESVGRGQVRLRKGPPTDAETFQWTETPYGDLLLLSLATHRHLRVEPHGSAVSADHPGPEPDRKDGSCFVWKAQAGR
ncbi:MAG: glycoside hydrolase 43 family protein [Blastocatellia bacterium]|nr:glycoside hydrolase 43 family protein [Blastocatellia bacterium]